MRIRLVFAAIALCASSLAGQEVRGVENYSPSAAERAQFDCENDLIRDMEAKEVFAGAEYDALVDVANAFGREKMPRLYIFEPTEGTGNNTYYIAGSAMLDGRGKFLMSRKIAAIMGSVIALKGNMAHEMSHLVLNLQRGERCVDPILGNPRTEREADAMAADKVGFGPVKAWLARVRAWTGETSFSDALSRIEALEALEAKRKEQRN